LRPDKIILDEADKFGVIKQIPDETKKLVASITPHKGHTLFEINCTSGEILPAQYESLNADINGAVKRKVLTKENCLYISCLNKKSAQKKYLQWLISKTV